MRNRLTSLLALLLLAALAAGCHSHSRIDTTRVEEAFYLVSGTNRVIVDKAISSARQGDLPQAQATFRVILEKYRLNPNQEMAVKDILQDIESRLPPQSSTTTNR